MAKLLHYPKDFDYPPIDPEGDLDQRVCHCYRITMRQLLAAKDGDYSDCDRLARTTGKINRIPIARSVLGTMNAKGHPLSGMERAKKILRGNPFQRVMAATKAGLSCKKCRVVIHGILED